MLKPPTKNLQQWLSLQLEGANTDREKVARILESFKSLDLRYTLAPGPVDSIDTLLFKSKKGFCEHFASSFATLLRLADVPSRVAIGFQGGAYNPNEGYLRVGEQDAHAWVEVYDRKEKLWYRVDPTSIVAPLRTRLGAPEYFQLSEEQRRQTTPALGAEIGGIGEFFNDLSWAYDAANYQLSLFLLKYDLEAQKQYLKSLGYEGDVWLLLISISVLVVLTFYFWNNNEEKSFTEKLSQPNKPYVLKAQARS